MAARFICGDKSACRALRLPHLVDVFHPSTAASVGKGAIGGPRRSPIKMKNRLISVLFQLKSSCTWKYDSTKQLLYLSSIWNLQTLHSPWVDDSPLNIHNLWYSIHSRNNAERPTTYFTLYVQWQTPCNQLPVELKEYMDDFIFKLSKLCNCSTQNKILWRANITWSVYVHSTIITDNKAIPANDQIIWGILNNKAAHIIVVLLAAVLWSEMNQFSSS